MMGEYDAGYENCIDAMVRQMEDMQFSIDSLHRENAKLRELLQRTWDAFHDATAREFVTVKNELRELGVEVDG